MRLECVKTTTQVMRNDGEVRSCLILSFAQQKQCRLRKEVPHDGHVERGKLQQGRGLFDDELGNVQVGHKVHSLVGVPFHRREHKL